MIPAESQDLFFQTRILADIDRKRILTDFQEKQEAGKEQRQERRLVHLHLHSKKFNETK
jgi:hypothetical protein